MTSTPTDEQQAVIDGFRSGHDLAVSALAGTGKTASCILMAETAPEYRGLYLAYNKAMQQEMQREAPSSIACKTTHSIAYGAVGYKFKDRLNASRKPPWDIAKFLGVGGNDWKVTPTVVLKPWQIARLALDAVARFCGTGDDEVQAWHVPKVEGVVNMQMIRDRVLPFAQKAWEDMQDPEGDGVPFSHDGYLALYARSNPTLDYDYILLDEAQDTSGSVARIFNGQAHAQRVVVGDRFQQMFAWRGGHDYVTKFATEHANEHLPLTRSFRFQQEIADEGNKWLELLGSELKLEGAAPHDSQVVGIHATPDAILCRTNAGVIDEAIAQIAAGRKTAIVGGLDDVKRFADAAEQLQNTGSTNHRDLQAFATWGEVQDYARTPDGADLAVWVRLIEKHGFDGIRKVAANVTTASRAEVVVSTVHRSKGLGWDAVQIGSDISLLGPEGDLQTPGEAEQMVFYVACTRAKKVLARGPLGLVDRLLTPEVIA